MKPILRTWQQRFDDGVITHAVAMNLAANLSGHGKKTSLSDSELGDIQAKILLRTRNKKPLRMHADDCLRASKWLQQQDIPQELKDMAAGWNRFELVYFQYLPMPWGTKLVPVYRVVDYLGCYFDYCIRRTRTDYMRGANGPAIALLGNYSKEVAQ